MRYLNDVKWHGSLQDFLTAEAQRAQRLRFAHAMRTENKDLASHLGSP